MRALSRKAFGLPVVDLVAVAHEVELVGVDNGVLVAQHGRAGAVLRHQQVRVRRAHEELEHEETRWRSGSHCSSAPEIHSSFFCEHFPASTIKTDADRDDPRQGLGSDDQHQSGAFDCSAASATAPPAPSPLKDKSCAQRLCMTYV